jgi:acyl-CoA thioester hydrolase
MGMPYSVIEETGAMLPLLEMKCIFKGFARYEDKIVVKTYIKEHSGTRLLFHYDVCKVDSENVITEGETLHVWTNSNLKPVNIKKYRPDINDLIEKVSV